MAKQETRVEYRFSMADGARKHFVICLDPECLELTCQTMENPPPWTRLEFHICAHCPLSPDEHLHCPLALAILQIVDDFSHIVSYEETLLEVVTKERTISQATTVQRGVSSLMGLLMATSGCPHLAFFRPMAAFHLPLATQQETMMRAVSMYLMAQYMRHRLGLDAKLEVDGLWEIYRNIEKVNLAMARRLRAASDQDSSVNALVQLDLYAKMVPLILDEALMELRPYFEAYLRP